MKVIVPLAGPDYIQKEHIVKSELQYNGEDILHYILKKRSWYKDIPSENYIFIFIDHPLTRKFFTSKVINWFPSSKAIFLSEFTKGAALTALSGLLYCDENEQIIVDLADIDYDFFDYDSRKLLSLRPNDALGLIFHSNNPVYSYLLFDKDGNFVKSAEKKVISENASAGTYIFGSLNCYLKALMNSLSNPEANTYNNLFYICPLFNGIKENNGNVFAMTVENIVDIKLSI